MINHKRRRLAAILTIVGGIIAVLMGLGPDSRANIAKLWREFMQYDLSVASAVQSDETSLELLEKLEVKGRAPKTGYDRALFASTWQILGKCSMRNLVLKRDLTDIIIDDNCRVISGILQDPYTGKEIIFEYGPATSQEIQIDHIVAVSDAWQKGAQDWDSEKRYKFYNDPNNLVAVSREANQAKVDSDAASWLPSNKLFRCAYVSRQIQVKLDYGLWVTEAEKLAMQQVLQRCPISSENIPR
ncbi:MAG: HNH endonuclease family protein [Candidatus Nanosyncoccaceae bacterium]|jgi:hypothetical protein